MSRLSNTSPGKVPEFGPTNPTARPSLSFPQRPIYDGRPMILLVSAPDDEHAAAVGPEIRRRGGSVLWMDLAELPARGGLTATFGTRSGDARLLRVRDTVIDLARVTAVWSRRPQPPAPDACIAGREIQDYVRQETTDTWHGVLGLLDCLWLPAPRWAEMRAAHKPIQLKTAIDVGFEVPPTLVTNSPEDFTTFADGQSRPLISKTVHNRLVPVGRPDRYTGYAITEVVANRDRGDSAAIRLCPITFQPYVDKRLELRVTVVGDRVFPVEMDSQRTNHTRRDWRRGDHHHLRYAVHDLPTDVAERSVALLKRLGLCYGAIDLILTPDGRYVFLEINPNGAWLWMERTTGLPIKEAVVNLLMSNESAARPDGAPVCPLAAEPPPTGLKAPPPARFAGAPPGRVRLPAGLDAQISSAVRSLSRLVTEGVSPTEAVARFRRLARRHRNTPMSLVWDFESYAGTFHYDALLQLPGATLSVALSPERGVPWALRHAHHARESDLVRVNGRTLNIQTVMGHLDSIWEDAALVQHLVDGCLIREAIDAHRISASKAEVRRAVVSFRAERGLTSDRALEAWLKRRGLTADDLQYEIERQTVAAKLRAAIAKGKVRAYFRRHRTHLDTAAIARLRVGDAALARRIARHMRRDLTPASAAVEHAIVNGETTPAEYSCEIVRRRDLPARVAKAVFSAQAGHVVGPLARDGAWDVLRVLRTETARLDRHTRAAIADLLFADWLESRRAAATVEWFWGDVDRAAGTTAARINGPGPA